MLTHFILGKTRSTFGWSPLHLACYFGHQDVVEELLKVNLMKSDVCVHTVGKTI